jgi:hypothetical protein
MQQFLSNSVMLMGNNKDIHYYKTSERIGCPLFCESAVDEIVRRYYWVAGLETCANWKMCQLTYYIQCCNALNQECICVLIAGKLLEFIDMRWLQAKHDLVEI